MKPAIAVPLAPTIGPAIVTAFGIDIPVLALALSMLALLLARYISPPSLERMTREQEWALTALLVLILFLAVTDQLPLVGQADQRFAEDIAAFGDSVSALIGSASTTQSQFDAMVSLAYNVGLGKFGGSTLLKMHKAGDHDGAAAQFARWDKANGKVMAGLTRRREAEAKMYRGQA
ncbi:lysozyme [Sphingobium naphthae]|uniref:Lysozyme n=1 Tax=Sphingobium naphthae TaxID=1886786 RepID=A0ABU3ZSC9_9SPHN|nr:lysozyme [Sphingobium naphthae]MDV5822287.1 lysozyme [Sphingobium naphthae]